MSRVKKDTVRVIKIQGLAQVKLVRIARKYGISAISVRELLLGHPEEIPRVVAEQLIADGYVVQVNSKLRTQQERISVITSEDKSPTTTSEDTEFTTTPEKDEIITIPEKDDAEIIELDETDADKISTDDEEQI